MDLLLRGLFIYSAGAAVSIFALGLAMPRRHSPGGRWLVFFLSVHSIWMAINAMVYLGLPLGVRIALLSMASVSALAPIALFLFSVEYANPSYRVGNRMLLPLAILPALSVALAVTNSLHGLYIKGATLDSISGVHIVEYGPVFYWMVYLGVSLVFLTAGMLLLTAIRSSGAVRTQSALIISGIVVMGLAYTYLTSLPSRPLGIDPAMAGVFMGVALAVAIGNSQLLRLSPVGRSEVFEMLPQGFIITDKSGTVVDANPAAVRLLDFDENRALFGESVSEIFTRWTCAGAPCTPQAFSTQVTALDPVGDAVPLGVQRWQLKDPTGQEIGQAYIVRDNSGDYWTKSQLEGIQQSLTDWSEDMHELERLLKRFG